MNHIMLDLETMGNRSNAAIVGIGAVRFDIETGETGHRFYSCVELASSLSLGLTVNASTIEWWMKQSEEARQVITVSPRETIDAALRRFAIFCGSKHFVWGNSASFDCGILGNAYDAIGMERPWSFRNERDVRTLVSFNPSIKENTEFVGTPHDPIDDCLHQISYCSAIWNSLSIKQELKGE